MIDPQTQKLMGALAAQGVAPISEVGPQKARELYLVRKALSQPDPVELADIRDFAVPGFEHGDAPVPVRLYTPDQPACTPTGLTVYFHGGGFVIGSVQTHDTLCRELCQQSGHAVLSVDYRLAPEHPFPAALHDCLAATQWVFEQAGHLKIDATRIAVAGDSAGGQLAAVIALTLRSNPQTPLALQLLIYPITDASMSQPSIERHATGALLTKATLSAYYDHYWPDLASRLTWRASPLLAEDLTGLPPAVILTAGYDPLHDEGRAYADRLAQSDIPTQYVCFDRQVHGFVPMGRVIDEARLAVDICSLVIRKHLS